MMKSLEDYEELIAFGIDDSSSSKILTAKEIEGEDYERLDRYIDEILPIYLEYNEDYKPYVKISRFIGMKFSLIELKHIIKYLKEKGIMITIGYVNTYFNKVATANRLYYPYQTTLGEISKLPKLPNDVQEELLRRYSKTHDKKIRDQLIRGNIRLVRTIMSRYTILLKRDDFQEDLFSYGIIGLMKAIDNYKVDGNSKFSTFAINCILQTIANYIRKNNNLDILCFNFLTAKSIIEEKFGTTLEKDFSLFEHIIDYMIENSMIRECDRELVEKRIILFLKKNYLNYEELGNMVDSEEVDDLVGEDEASRIVDILESLDYKEREPLRLKFGFVDGEAHTLKEIADILNISIPTVKKRVEKGLKKIRIEYGKRGVINEKRGTTNSVDRRI